MSQSPSCVHYPLSLLHDTLSASSALRITSSIQDDPSTLAKQLLRYTASPQDYKQNDFLKRRTKLRAWLSIAVSRLEGDACCIVRDDSCRVFLVNEITPCDSSYRPTISSACFHSNYMRILYCFSDQSKIAIFFSAHLYLTAPLRVKPVHCIGLLLWPILFLTVRPHDTMSRRGHSTVHNQSQFKQRR